MFSGSFPRGGAAAASAGLLKAETAESARIRPETPGPRKKALSEARTARSRPFRVFRHPETSRPAVRASQSLREVPPAAAQRPAGRCSRLGVFRNLKSADLGKTGVSGPQRAVCAAPGSPAARSGSGAGLGFSALFMTDRCPLRPAPPFSV